MKLTLSLLLFALLLCASNFAETNVYAASKKLPQGKITQLVVYYCYDNNYNDFSDDGEDYSPKHEYWNEGDYTNKSGFYMIYTDIKCRKEKGNVKYQFASKEGKGPWDKFSYGKGRTVQVYDLKKDLKFSVKVRTYKDIKGKRVYGKWSPIATETTSFKYINCKSFYSLTGRNLHGYVKGAHKGEFLKVKIGRRTIKHKIKKTANKYRFKIRLGKQRYGKKFKVELFSKTKDLMFTYTDTIDYAKNIRNGMTKKQVRRVWGSPENTGSASGGWSYWYYDDGSYVGFRRGRVDYWYSA